ncbi:MAG: hypothetical protein HQM11_05000 [SAR324 cluster bacterium]|nr:hypothetical protein [SAR324 cluster bacterium]
MSESIETLAQLGSVDVELLVSRNRVRELERVITQARQIIQTQEEKTQQIEKAHQDCVENAKKAELELLHLTDSIAKMEAQIPMIRNQKEFAASKRQMEEGRKRRGVLENSVLEYQIQIEELTAKREEAQSQLQVAENDFKKQTKDEIKEKKSLEASIKNLIAQKKESMAALTPKIRNYYERCIANGITNPVCRVLEKENACGGCNMKIQPQLINEMRVHPDKHQICPHCARVLYYLFEPETEKEVATN